jgi:hypothetical protein
MPVILEGIVTTLDSNGNPNIAPMGAHLGPDLSLSTFVLRPYQDTSTFRNLANHGAGVFHLTDDVLLLTQAALGLPLDPPPPLTPAHTIRGWIISNACNYAEFRVNSIDASQDRATVSVSSLAIGRFRDFLGFNRARHAVVEAAILGTRLDFLPHQEIRDQFQRLAPLVEKTGGPLERRAFQVLLEHVQSKITPPTLPVTRQSQ